MAGGRAAKVERAQRGDGGVGAGAQQKEVMEGRHETGMVFSGAGRYEIREETR